MVMFFKEARHIFSNSALFLKSYQALGTWNKFTAVKRYGNGTRTRSLPSAVPFDSTLWIQRFLVLWSFL